MPFTISHTAVVLPLSRLLNLYVVAARSLKNVVEGAFLARPAPSDGPLVTLMLPPTVKVCVWQLTVMVLTAPLPTVPEPPVTLQVCVGPLGWVEAWTK